MKTFLLTTAAALSFASASQAAIIQYEFRSAQMSYVHPDPNPQFRYMKIGAAIRIDTEALEAKQYDFMTIPSPHPDDAMPKGFLNVSEDTNMHFRVSFDDLWNITAFDISLDSDGTDRGLSDKGSWSRGVYYYETDYLSEVGGTWAKTILADASVPFDRSPFIEYTNEPVEAPAPVPLPAAGLLLMGAVAGLGMVKRWNKAAA